ncbi:SET domain-containing protein-lysine N-methyltransferase [Nannocystis pusilla]|uniref:SET domain-containing protein-lysine N-methyltransferase n=1 Tax=Nannocystis pusilla TaxID=889268 RepID=A0A9X3IYU2_9BACT|nr:SET domain-containing protein-lysine N-methyltransferase [Nannocystis pusilla]
MYDEHEAARDSGDDEAEAALRRSLSPRAVSPGRSRQLLEVRGSEVHGRGVYARSDIAPGEPVLTFGGMLVAAATVAEDLYAMQVGPALWLVSRPGSEDIEDFMNHGCEPNLGFVDGSVTLHALRPIRAGEEVLWDYSTSMCEPGWSVPCACGAPGCRGRIASFCDLSPGAQARLRPHALAYLRE